MNTLALFGLPGWQEACIIVGVGLLIFGKRIPGVARSLGQTVVEFKRGLKGHVKAIDSPAKQLDRS